MENNGESAVSVLPGANECLSPDDIEKRKRIFKNAAFCLISTEIPIETAIRAALIAKSYNVKSILKPAALKKMPAELLCNIDIFVANKKEASIFCTEFNSFEEQARYFYRQGVGTVIITLGGDGCYLKNAALEKYFPAADFQSIDTTGGADAFISGLVSYLMDGYSLETAIEIATYAAGFCISKHGVIPALVDKPTLESHIFKNNPKLLS